MFGMKSTIADALSKRDEDYLARIDRSLGQIKTIHRDIVRKRSAGRKVKVRIDRHLKEIQAIIDRVEATL